MARSAEFNWQTEPDETIVVDFLKQYLGASHALAQSKGDRSPTLTLGQLTDRPYDIRRHGPIFVAAYVGLDERLRARPFSESDPYFPVDVERTGKIGQAIFDQLNVHRQQGADNPIDPAKRKEIAGAASDIVNPLVSLAELAIDGLKAGGWNTTLGTARDALLAVQYHASMQTGTPAA